VFSIGKEAVHLQNVLMVSQMAVDFDLSSELLLDSRFNQLLFVQYFECHYELGLLFTCQVDVAKLAAT